MVCQRRPWFCREHLCLYGISTRTLCEERETKMGQHSARCTAVPCGRKTKAKTSITFSFFSFFLETMMCLVSIGIGTLMTCLPT